MQPVSVAFTQLDGWAMGRFLRPAYAWYGDMDMVSHIWQWAGLGRLTVVVEFHPTVTLEQFGSRKALSEHCYQAVSQGVAGALAGRKRSQRKALAKSAAEEEEEAPSPPADPAQPNAR